MKSKQIAEAKQVEDFKAATFKRQYNPFDGLVHTDDGKKYNLDGQEVGPDAGAVQLGDHFDDDAELKFRKMEASKWGDGLIHNKDGTLTDPVTNQQVYSHND